MPDYSALLSRIEELRILRGIPSPRALSMLATGKPDAIRQLQRGNRPTRERLRAFARVLGCELLELEMLAPDVRLDSRIDAGGMLLDIYDSVPPDRRDAFVEAVKAQRRLIGN